MADPTGPGIIEGTENDDVINSGYTDDDGDSVTSGADAVYGNGGSDTIEGGDGNDTIYGGHGTDAEDDTRESFNWSLLESGSLLDLLSDGSSIYSPQTQNTGTVDVTFSTVTDYGVKETYQTNTQNISGIDGGAETVDANSSLQLDTNYHGETGTYALDFSDSVTDVDFRVNDIDHDSVVTIVAYDAAGNQIPVTITASGDTKLVLSDTDAVAGVDTASATDNSGAITDGDNSILVEIAGPVARIEITHRNDGGDNSNISVSDVFFSTATDLPDEGDSISGGDGDDLIYGQEGADTIDGGAGNDTIYGGGGEETTTSEREIFEWSADPAFCDNKDISGFTQDTGHATITFSTTGGYGDPETEFSTSTQYTGDLDAAVGENSSLQSILREYYESASYAWDSDTPVENVEFRINDIDGDGRVVVRAYDENGAPVEVTLTDAGTGLALLDTDGVAGFDTAKSIDNNYTDNDNPEHSVLVTIEGPVSRWEILHEQDGYDDSGITVTDIAFDVPVVTEGSDDGAGDSLSGGDGNDIIYGQGGDDTITGGAGADTMLGGDGDDTFLVADGTHGNGDTITGGTGPDETTDHDVLDLTGSGSRTINATADTNDAGALTGTVTFENGDILNFSGIEEIICFTPGTAILTPSGEVAVEDLKVGDRVVTRDNGLQTIRWIGKKQLSGRDLLARPKLRPVMIRAGSLGPNLPDRDMMVSPNHRMLLVNRQAQLLFEETEVLVAAKHLIGMGGVQQVDRTGVEYVHFLCDNHEVVLANGAWSESFQPGEYSMGSIDCAQRKEIYDLFPELRNTETLKDFSAARLTLKQHEANLLVK